MFFEMYKKYAVDFIFQSEDAKLGELLNVRLNVRQKTRIREQKQFVTISDPFTVIDKEVNV